jgi:predicted dinucleotide-binding enzyme
MKIAILGTGSVGGTLGRRWTAAGHEICYGSRNPADGKVRGLVRITGRSTRAGTLAEAANFGEVVVLAVPYEALDSTLQGAGDLAGKVVLDCTNPLRTGADFLERGLLIGHDNSAGEEVARLLPKARVVKTLNTVGWPVMDNPSAGDDRAAMFHCGDDAAARATTAALIEELGFEPVDCGPLKNARLLEPVGMLWITLALTGRGTSFAYKLLKLS